MVNDSWMKIFLLCGMYVIAYSQLDVKQCEKYKGRICDQLDYDEKNKTILIYVDKRYSQNEMESHLRKLMVKLDEHPYVSCVSFIKQVLCRRFFPVCRRKNGEAYSVQQTCRPDCERAKTSVCYSAVKDIPELSERLLHVSCMTLPFVHCQTLTIPSKQVTKEQSCQLGHYKLGSQLEKVNILRNFMPVSARTVALKDTFIAGGSNCQNTKCVHVQTMLSHLVKNINETSIKNLRNLIIEQPQTRVTNGYCYRNCSSNIGYIQLLKIRIGNIRQYMIDKYLRLRNVDVYIEKNINGVFVTGKGVYNLCGKLFSYKLWPTINEFTIMHSTSNQSINMLVIELSHRLKPFPREIESILAYKLKVVETLNINNPTWSIVWHQGSRLSAFKGISTIKLEEENIKNVKTELMIGADLSFWTIKLTMKLKLDQILRSVLPISIEMLPFVNKGWYIELAIGQVEYIFSTDGVDIPTTEYLKQHYSLYEDFQTGKGHRGMYVKFHGRIRRPKVGSVQLPLLEDKTLFQIRIDSDKNGNIKFDAQFKEDTAVVCSSKLKNHQHWKNFIRRLKTVQAKSNHTENSIVKTKAECGHCCDSNAFTLLSIKGNTYQEHRFLLTQEIIYFVDFEISVLKKDTIHKYVTKRYKVYSV